MQNRCKMAKITFRVRRSIFWRSGVLALKYDPQSRSAFGMYPDRRRRSARELHRLRHDRGRECGTKRVRGSTMPTPGSRAVFADFETWEVTAVDGEVSGICMPCALREFADGGFLPSAIALLRGTPQRSKGRNQPCSNWCSLRRHQFIDNTIMACAYRPAL
jgi:hypothetical protein